MKSLIFVMAGGAAGSGLRYLLGRMFPVGSSGWPWGTFAANILGGFAMGVLAAWLLRAGNAGEQVRLIFGVGLLGGFTTFSAYSLELVQMIQRGNGYLAIGYAMASLILAVLAVIAGTMIAERVLA